DARVEQIRGLSQDHGVVLGAAEVITIRHARLYAGHPRLPALPHSKTWMAGTSPAMTLRSRSSPRKRGPSFQVRLNSRSLLRQSEGALASRGRVRGNERKSVPVMPGFTPGIHVFCASADGTL